MEDLKASCEDFPAHFVTVSEIIHTSRFLLTRLCISISIILPIPSSSRRLDSIMAHSLKNFMRHLFHKPRPRSPRTASYANHNPLNIDEYQALDEPDRYTPAGLKCRKKASVERLRPHDLQQPPNPPENSASRIRRRLQKDRSERRTGRAPQGGVTATARNAFHVSPAETKRQSPARLSTRDCQSTSGVPAHVGSSNTAPRPLRGNARSRASEPAPTSQRYTGEERGGQRRSTTRRDPLLADRLPRSGRRPAALSGANPSILRSGVYFGSAPHVASGSGGRRPAPEPQRASRKPLKRRSDNGRSRFVEPTGHRAQEQSRSYNGGLSGASTSPTTRPQPKPQRIAQLPRLWRGVSFAPSSAATSAEVGNYRHISIDEEERLDVSRTDGLCVSGRLTRRYSWLDLVDVQIRAPMTSPQCFPFLWHATNISSLEIGHLVNSSDYRKEWPMEVHALNLKRLTILRTEVPITPLLKGLRVLKLTRLEVQYGSSQPEHLFAVDARRYERFFDIYRKKGTFQSKGSVLIASKNAPLPKRASLELRDSLLQILRGTSWKVVVNV
ncbi:uncharacterized protein SCHCODRAFT_02731257 [Schizophyllum commune H4-8]|nr:uncharacterized protein SCHCODRAFT_02731257 [Schizophyllum commune H4-8]KAI5894193.1 hypothetical protein SCHCODRAFT_02731257 [Schizophyllum commune H4-8]